MKSSITAADIMKVKAFPPYDLLFCDPPWEKRMVSYFQTVMRKTEGYAPDNTIDGIIGRLGALADTSKPMVVEYGVKGWGWVKKAIQAYGHRHSDTIFSSQENGNPYVLLVFNTPSGWLPDGNIGFGNLRAAVSLVGPGKTVFDPFAGIGRSAEVAIKAGAVYLGYELNPARAKRGQEKIIQLQANGHL